MKKNLGLFLLFLVLAALAFWVYRTQTSSTLSDQPLTDFAIEDTASVTKLFIVDHTGKTALIERVPGKRLWMLNKKYQAREDAVNLILTTLKRIRVRGNVPEAGKQNMLKVIASSGKKVEVYQGGDKPSKIYYVGPATPDHYGTVMLLEIPGVGRSEEPYITHMEGFTGFLNTRFFADEMEWRYTGIYYYPNLEFQRVSLLYPSSPASSFEVEYKGGNDIQLRANPDPISGHFKTPVAQFDSLKVKDFLLLFKKVHFETYNTYLKPSAADSISKTIPFCTITVTDNGGKAHPLHLYMKRAREGYSGPDGWDPEYYWGRNEEGYLGLAQMFVFNPILQPLGFFTGSNVDPSSGEDWIK